MSQTQAVGPLLAQAVNQGALAPAALQALNLVDVGGQFNMGLSIDDYEGTEAVLVTIMPDDSGSIRFGSNAQAVRDGHNGVIDALSGSKQSEQVLFRTQYLNGFVLNPFVLLDNAIRMDSKNYDPNLGTPLFENSLMLLAAVLAKTQEYQDAGVPVRTVTLIVTDGGDTGGGFRTSARDVKKVVSSMLMSEQHIVAGMGVDDGMTDFRKVFSEMGIRNEWILTPGNDAGDIRRAFAVFSKSAVRASQSAVSFSQVALGGFASP